MNESESGLSGGYVPSQLDFFAAHALQGLLASSVRLEEWDCEDKAWGLARLMVARKPRKRPRILEKRKTMTPTLAAAIVLEIFGDKGASRTKTELLSGIMDVCSVDERAATRWLSVMVRNGVIKRYGADSYAIMRTVVNTLS